MNKLITPAILNSYRPKKDKSVSITFETQEYTAQQIGELHGLVGSYGALVFKPEDQLTSAEIKEIDELDLEVGGKTKAQRLRNVLYKVWETTESEVEFKDFYAEKMEGLIDKLKEDIL